MLPLADSLSYNDVWISTFETNGHRYNILVEDIASSQVWGGLWSRTRRFSHRSQRSTPSWPTKISLMTSRPFFTDHTFCNSFYVKVSWQHISEHSWGIISDFLLISYSLAIMPHHYDILKKSVSLLTQTLFQKLWTTQKAHKRACQNTIRRRICHKRTFLD